MTQFGVILPYTRDLEYWGFDFDYVTIYLPEDVKQRIMLYDTMGHMEPFSFSIQVSVPKDALTLGTDLQKHQQKKRELYYERPITTGEGMIYRIVTLILVCMGLPYGFLLFVTALPHIHTDSQTFELFSGLFVGFMGLILIIWGIFWAIKALSKNFGN